jgi:hypothetical protein
MKVAATDRCRAHVIHVISWRYPPTVTDDKWVLRWVEHLQRLSNELLQLNHNRELFQAVRDAVVVVPADDAPDTWLDHYAYVYGHAQAIAVRRVAKGKPSEVSLAGMLGEMREHPTVFTAERHIGLYSDVHEHLRRRAERKFDEEWGDGSGHVDPNKLHGRLSGLLGDMKNVIDWADTVVAHIAGAGPAVSITYVDLHAAIDRLGEAFNDLSILLTASEWVLTPKVQDDWRLPFRQPLFPPHPKLPGP